MSTTEPSKWSTALGASADVNTLPQSTPAGTGLASLSGLFPQITQIPIDSGGIAPERADFNALFKLLGESIFFLMQGGKFSYSASYDYSVGNIVLYNGEVYRCIQAHSAGTADPSNTAYWTKIIDAASLSSAISAAVGNGTITIQKNGVDVDSFTVNQSSNKTINITVPASSTVNDGTLTIQRNSVNVATFTANQAGNSTANITVPTKMSDLTQDISLGGPAILILGIRDLVVSNGTASSQFDTDMHAAGYWRCGVGYADWFGYGQGAKGYSCFIAYAPAGHTVTQLDIDIAEKYVGTQGMNDWASTPLSSDMTLHIGWEATDVPASASAVQNYVTIPTAGMTSASEVAMPHNIITTN